MDVRVDANSDIVAHALHLQKRHLLADTRDCTKIINRRWNVSAMLLLEDIRHLAQVFCFAPIERHLADARLDQLVASSLQRLERESIFKARLQLVHCVRRLLARDALMGSLVWELSIKLTSVVNRSRLAASSGDSGVPSALTRPRSARRSSCPFSSHPMVSTGVTISARCCSMSSRTRSQFLGTRTFLRSSSVSSILMRLASGDFVGDNSSGDSAFV